MESVHPNSALQRSCSNNGFVYPHPLSLYRYIVKHALTHLRACALHAPVLLRDVEANAAFMLAQRLQDVAANGMHSFYHHVRSALHCRVVEILIVGFTPHIHE